MSHEEKDPRTVEALEKIKAVLREHDLFAALTVVSVERMHWLYHTEPSWSCLTIDPATGAARIRAKAADFATPEQHHKVVELTTGAIACCRDQGAIQFTQFSQLYDMLAKQFEIDHEMTDVEYKKS